MSTSPAKKEVMFSRKITTVEVVPVSKAHSVYLMVQRNPGLTKEEYAKALVGPDSDVKMNDVHCAFHDFIKKGYFMAHGRGRGANQVFTYEVDPSVPYTPRPTMRKVAPNDIKAQKSVAKKTGKEDSQTQLFSASGAVSSAEIDTPAAAPEITIESSVPAKEKPVFQLIHGLAAIDPSHPHFGQVVRDEAEKLGIASEAPFERVGPVKPIVSAFMEVGNQLLHVTLQDMRQMYDELHSVFGKEEATFTKKEVMALLKLAS